MRRRRSLLLVGVLLLLAVAAGRIAWRASGRVAGGGAERGLGHPIDPDAASPSAALAARSGGDRGSVESPSIAASPDETEEDPSAPTDPAPRPAGWPAHAPTVLCRVRIVDAVTGAPIDRRWHFRQPTQAGPPPPPPGAPPPSPVEAPRRAPEADERERGAGDAAALLRMGTQNARIRCYPLVDPYDDAYVQWDDGSVDGIPTVAAGVEEVLVRVPLRRALTLEVHVLGPTGAPARGARLARLRVDGRTLVDDQALVDDEGVARIARVPFVPGARLEGDVEWTAPPDEGMPSTADEPGHVVPAEPPLRVRIPSSVPSPWRATARLEGPTGVPETGLGVRIEDFSAYPLDFDLADDGPERGRVIVRALGWEGHPAAGAEIEGPGDSEDTDLQGFARFQNVPAGERTFTLASEDRFRANATVRVRGGAEATVTLVEPRGGRLEVLVVDEEGHPCPTARIEIEGASSTAWFDVDRGVQRLDPFTDEHGRRSIARVAPGKARIRATAAGGRTAEAHVDVRDGLTQSLRLVARPPAPPDPALPDAK